MLITHALVPLWKILHLAGADWTYGSRGWAGENYCMFLADDSSWEHVTRTTVEQANSLKVKTFLNTVSQALFSQNNVEFGLFGDFCKTSGSRRCIRGRLLSGMRAVLAWERMASVSSRRVMRLASVAFRASMTVNPSSFDPVYFNGCDNH